MLSSCRDLVYQFVVPQTKSLNISCTQAFCAELYYTIVTNLYAMLCVHGDLFIVHLSLACYLLRPPIPTFEIYRVTWSNYVLWLPEWGKKLMIKLMLLVVPSFCPFRLMFCFSTQLYMNLIFRVCPVLFFP